ncbi:MAG: 2-oxo acid dehydrogenase subunit E2 [Anaerolineales bacterium]|nr:2-oxo acid dehydrogenase subunit E2 [Anaerolineales bacterium]
MTKTTGYRTSPFSTNRRMVSASAAVGRSQNNIQALTEVDITEPLRIINEHKQKTGERLSLTAYIVTCLARAIAKHPHLNAIRKGSRLILLDEVSIGVVVEREIDGEIVPENMGVQAAQRKTYQQICDQIREAQEQQGEDMGALSDITWVRFIPSFLFRLFIRLASKNLWMIKRFGAVGVTAVGMFCPRNQATWMIPLVGGATVALAIGGIVDRPCIKDGQLELRSHLCLTFTFNHDIVDGAPAARFLTHFSELLSSGELLFAETDTATEGKRPGVRIDPGSTQ